MFFLLYKRTDGGVFDEFPKISDNFPKISENLLKLFRRADERSRTFSEDLLKFPKMSEDSRRLSRNSRRWYTNEFKYILRDKLDVNEIIDIFTCEDIIFSHVRISYCFYQFVSTRYTTDFYIIFITCHWTWSSSSVTDRTPLVLNQHNLGIATEHRLLSSSLIEKVNIFQE